MSRITRQQMMVEIMGAVEKRSTCLRKKVAALIEKDGRIISIGYNGPASGLPECTTEGKHKCLGPGCDRSIHAEVNAIAYAAREGISVKGATLYCSMSPCINCAKIIINSGIEEVLWKETYRDTSGVELLEQSGLLIKEITE